MTIKEILNKKVNMFKIYHFIINSIWILYILFLIAVFCLCMYFCSNVYIIDIKVFAGYIIISILIYIWFKYISNKSNFLWIIVQIVITIFIAYLLLFFAGFVLFLGLCAEKPLKFQYSHVIKEQKYYDPAMSHFPDKLPKNTKKYYMLVDEPWQDGNTYYVKFKTDRNYIDDVIKDNEKNLYKYIQGTAEEKCLSYLSSICFPPYTDLYILNNGGGIAVNKYTNTIWFFYENE